MKKLAFEGQIRMFRKRDGYGYRPTYFGVDGDLSVTRTEDRRVAVGWDWVIDINKRFEEMSVKGQMPPRGAQLPDWEKNI
jgi:hypothetical protein